MTILDRNSARKVISAHYGEAFSASAKFLSRSVTIGVRPVVDTMVGRVTLAWQSVAPGRDSAVRVGIVHDPRGIDVDWDVPTEELMRPPGVAQAADEAAIEEPEAGHSAGR
jgi:hypothetical protein